MSIVPTEQVYTLADLENWPPEKAQFPSDGVALAVIGHPVAHSLSPAMHNAALAVLAKTKPEFANWRYYKFQIHPNELGTAITLFREKQFLGLNLTVPHKTDVLNLPNFYLKPEQQFVREMGAANTLKHEESKWYGYNTDGPGLRKALQHDLDIEHLEKYPVVLLGAGGAARAAAVMCLKCESLWIGNRTESNLNQLIERLENSVSLHSREEKTTIRGFDPNCPPADLPENAVVINATSLGLKSTDQAPLDLRKIPKPIAVFDMIYRPAETELLRQARSMAIPAENGLSMLVFQGASSLRHWIGDKIAGINLPSEVVIAMHEAVRNKSR